MRQCKCSSFSTYYISCREKYLLVRSVGIDTLTIILANVPLITFIFVNFTVGSIETFIAFATVSMSGGNTSAVASTRIICAVILFFAMMTCLKKSGKIQKLSRRWQFRERQNYASHLSIQRDMYTCSLKVIVNYKFRHFYIYKTK